MKQRNFQMIETNGVTLRTVVEGQGPLVVLLHGFPQCWYLWRHQIDPLVAAGFQVAVPDQRGYGGSDRPERGNSLLRFVGRRGACARYAWRSGFADYRSLASFTLVND